MKCLLLINLFLISAVCTAQKTIAKFRITEAKVNGNDATEWYLDRKQVFVFYDSKKGEFCMSNYSEVKNEQSYGTLTTTEKPKTLKETEDTYLTNVFTFRWNYTNDYDKKSGWATVMLLKIYKPQGIAFSMKLVTSGLEVAEYMGYMDGTLNLSKF